MASRGGAFAFVALCLLDLALHGAAEPLAPAMFVFGDSTVDVGNNNYLKKCKIECKADYPRYGVDYPDQAPTGRFSNGYNLADQLAQLLGFPESPPPFLSLPNDSLIPQMSKGISFASGGSGLLDNTSSHACGEVLSMTNQVRNFTSLARQWKIENQTAADLVTKSLFFISVGSNDLFEHADITVDNRNDTEFLQLLVASYSSYLKDLHRAGAKKFSVVSPSLLGCCPSQRLIAQESKDFDKYGCFGSANNLSKQLYPMIASMLHDLTLELPGMNYSLGDSIRMAEGVFNNTHTPAYNFTVLSKACCGVGDFGASGCNSSVPLCQNRANYMFWDKFHPTDAASAVTAKELFGNTGSFVHPINVQQLVTSQP
ncbi:GDSL esterase/lipase At5g55050-like [Phragmites australis]|uniref:GDSL esterase/lipase At5g55050-like n=1 Tax=Phragmites australis TaxID=29695 RepID=UPI002D771005|nr:GDSL esterase/lipase At5g55050-like [Phragmites australis]